MQISKANYFSNKGGEEEDNPRRKDWSQYQVTLEMVRVKAKVKVVRGKLSVGLKFRALRLKRAENDQ
jgi:hypothetical protein